MFYIWHTQSDELVRNSHAPNHGQVFTWDNPPPTGHPGEDYNCRCTPIPFSPSALGIDDPPIEPSFIIEKLIIGGIIGGGIRKIGSAVGKVFRNKPPASKEPSRFDNAVSKLSTKGRENVQKLQNWAKDKGFVKKKNNDGPEVWGVYDKNGNFSWRLKIKPESSARDGLRSGSQQPRFDARLEEGQYHNPLTGKTGGKEIGTHINLE
ncbi:MAG: phage minor head protein [Pseudomonadota bacterium]